MPKLTPTRVLASIFCFSLGATTAAGAGTVTSNSHVPRWLSSATRVGSERDTRRVTVSAWLNFRDQTGLEKLVEAQSTPGNPQYGHYLTPAQFHARFSPPASDVTKVRNELQRLGFRVEHVPASGLYVRATGTVKQIKAAFHVTQDLYKYQGKVMRSNAQAPTLPASIAKVVTFVGGLDESGLLVKPAHIGPESAADLKRAAGVNPNAPPGTYNLAPALVCSHYWGDRSASVSPAPDPYAGNLPWLNCGYTPDQMRQAYGSDKVAQDGTGVVVAIVDAFASPTIARDTNDYSRRHGLPALDGTNFSQVVPHGIYKVDAGNVCGPQGWYVEETLDVESVHSMAPGAQILYVGGEDCFNDNLEAAFYKIVDEGLANIISNSYGFNGEPLSAEEDKVQNAMFQQAAAEGITVLFSSGDRADVSQYNGIASGSWPASSPHVTAVGGTSLALYDSSGNKSEAGWGTFRALLTDPTVHKKHITDQGVGSYSFYAGAGGGASLFEKQPHYQEGTVPDALSTGTYDINGNWVPFDSPHRVVPDVSLDADPYSGFLMGITFTVATPGGDPGCKVRSNNPNLEYCEFAEGGTSLSSPALAGVLALVDQARFAAGKAGVGFANPMFYRARVGAPGSTHNAIVDVQPPASPSALLRGYAFIPNTVRLVTINSIPYSGCPNGVCEGQDGNFLVTTTGYDDVTGLGTPYVPKLIEHATK